LNGQLPPRFVKRLTMDRNLCKEMVRICLMASETASLLDSFFDAAVLSRYETKCSLSIQLLVSKDVFRPIVQTLTPIATSRPPQPCFTATSSIPMAPRQLLCKVAVGPWLRTPPTMLFSLCLDDQPWAADFASAALDHSDYDCVAGPASAALLYGESECSDYVAGLISSDRLLPVTPRLLRRRAPPGCHPCQYSRRLAPYPIRVSAASL